MPRNFYELESGGDNSYAVPPRWKVGGRVPPRPPPINARTDMTNIYWTKIKLRAAANQAILIHLLIFHWVVGSLYLNW